MTRKVVKDACPNYRRGCCGFLKMLVRKINVNSPLSRRGAGGEAYEQDYVYSMGINYYADGKGLIDIDFV